MANRTSAARLFCAAFITFGLALAVSLPSLWQPATAATNNDRWFEVEVVVFRHLNSSSQQTAEVFPSQITPIPVLAARDLLSPLLNPQKLQGLIAALPLCSWVSDLPQGLGKFHLQPLYQLEPVDHLFNREQPSADIFCRYHEHTLVVDQLSAPTPAPPGMEIWPQTPVLMAGIGGDIEQASGPFLLPAQASTLNQLKQQLERRGLAQALLHTSWRQPVFNRNNSQYLRLFAGKNYTAEFDYLGFAKPQEEFELYSPLEPSQSPQQLEQIQHLLQAVDSGQFQFVRPTLTAKQNTEPTGALSSSAPRARQALPQTVWELDGLFRVYLVGNYLHIDTELNLREPEQQTQQLSSVQDQVNAWLQREQMATEQKSSESTVFLRAYHLKQVRRVISHEVHYFDHPKFGVLVEIRRTERSQR